MELTIPIQIFDVGKVVVSPPQRGTKLIAPLSYVNGDAHFSLLSISLSSLPVKSYDSATGQLQVSLQGSKEVATKLQQLQDMLIQTVITNQRGWFPTEKGVAKEDIRGGFQPFVDHGILHLYYPSNSDIGQNISIALRIQGLSFHQHHITKAWTGKFRLQHRILAII